MIVVFWIQLFALVMSVVALVGAIVSFVRAVKNARTTRWAILRSQVHMSRALASQKRLEESTQDLLNSLKGVQPAEAPPAPQRVRSVRTCVDGGAHKFVTHMPKSEPGMFSYGVTLCEKCGKDRAEVRR